MNSLYLFFSILGETSAYTLDKLNFKRNHATFRQVVLLGFAAMAIIVWLYILLTRQSLPQVTAMSIFLMALIIMISLVGNIFDYLSLKANDLSLREPLIDFIPVLAGLLAYILFPAERNHVILLGFVIGTFITYWGIHKVRLRRLQKNGLGYLVFAVVLYAILPSLYQGVLQYIAPAYITALRVTGIVVLLAIFMPIKSRRGLTPKRLWYCFLSGLTASIGAIAGLYAIQAYGVVLTMLFMMLGPALRYLAGQFILHEKVRRTEVISSVMLSVVVAATAFIQWA